jgi:hypothetical protein
MHQADGMDGRSVQSGRFLCECVAFDRYFAEKLGAACGDASVYVIYQCSDGCSDVSSQFDLRPVVIVDVSRHYVDVNQIPLLPAIP